MNKPNVQDIVDTAGSIVDLLLKSNRIQRLNDVLSRLDVERLPSEAILAFLVTSRCAAQDLPARQQLITRFETALRAQNRSDADILIRIAKESKS
jgi:hypothetical protein